MTGRAACITLLLSAAFLHHCASPSFTVEMEPSGTKILKGFFSRSDIEKDTLFPWFKYNYDSYQVDSAVIKELKPRIHELHFIIVLGTWCSDSKLEVPKIYKIFDALNISDNDIRLLGVDRSKKSQDGTTEKYNVHRVPTLIVFRGEKELGRMVENPRESEEQDLLKMLQQK